MPQPPTLLHIIRSPLLPPQTCRQVLWVFSRPVETSAYTITLRMDYQLTPNNLDGGWGAVHLPPYPAHLQEVHQVYPI